MAIIYYNSHIVHVNTKQNKYYIVHINYAARLPLVQYVFVPSKVNH